MEEAKLGVEAGVKTETTGGTEHLGSAENRSDSQQIIEECSAAGEPHLKKLKQDDNTSAAPPEEPSVPSSQQVPDKVLGKRHRDAGVKLGYKTFERRDECTSYFRDILAHYEKDLFLNEYEYLAVLDLLMKGHPKAKSKVGCGLLGIQIREFRGDSKAPVQKGSLAFHVVRKDWTTDDFSYLKCLQVLFPGGPSFNPSAKKSHGSSPGWGGRRGGGRGGRRGGRGSGRPFGRRGGR